MNNGFFPFELYIHSSNEREYDEDVKKKNSICKYVTALKADSNDKVALQKFVNNLYYFGNIFCKDAFLYFYLNKFDKEERKLIGRVVFDIFVKDNAGEIGEQREYYQYCYDILDDLGEEDPNIIDNWKEIQK